MKKVIFVLFFIKFPACGMLKLKQLREQYNEQRGQQEAEREKQLQALLEEEFKGLSQSSDPQVNQFLYKVHCLHGQRNSNLCCKIHLRLIATIPGVHKCKCCSLQSW